ncbi:hypothetical protein T10_9767 [Trichinella papuae]|uniref:Uncharacterized protein n=1 Tax=Trichinella papuae TaxID=268474 RepID=A0A0V1MXV2_9BILA|nr:hypothetical protein T10_9767 [Trichinella papuae]
MNEENLFQQYCEQIYLQQQQQQQLQQQQQQIASSLVNANREDISKDTKKSHLSFTCLFYKQTVANLWCLLWDYSSVRTNKIHGNLFILKLIAKKLVTFAVAHTYLYE